MPFSNGLEFRGTAGRPNFFHADFVRAKILSFGVRVSFTYVILLSLSIVLSAEYSSGYVVTLLVQFALRNKGSRPSGWAPRVLRECEIPYSEIWELFHEMYESQVSTSAVCQWPLF